MIQICISLQKLKLMQFWMNHDYILLTVSLGPISPSKLVWSAVSKKGPISDYLFFLNWTTMYSIYACSKLVKCPCLKWICGGKQNISHSVWILYMCTQLISSIQVKNITHMHAIVQAFNHICVHSRKAFLQKTEQLYHSSL